MKRVRYSEPYPKEKKTNKRTWPLTSLSVLAIGYTIYFAQAVLFPIVLAFLLYFLFSPAVRMMRGIKIPRSLGSGLVLTFLLFFTSFVISRFVIPATQWLEAAPTHLLLIEKKLSFLKKPIARGLEIFEHFKNIDLFQNGEKLSQLDVQLNSTSFGYTIFDLTSSAFTTAAATAVLFYFLLVYGDHFLNRAKIILRASAKHENSDVIQQVERGISTYLITFLLINACLGLVIGIALWILGVPNPSLWGAMAAILNFIPYLGPIVGSIVVLLVSLLSFETGLEIALPPIVYFTINSIEGQFITPVLLSKKLSLNPIVVLISMMLWGWAWGIEGALLSIPLLATFKIVCENIPKMRKVSSLIEA